MSRKIIGVRVRKNNDKECKEDYHVEEIIVATNNDGKVQGIKEILGDFDICSLRDKGISIEVLEDGKTFYDNALKKAVEIYNISKEPVIADASGLCVTLLNNFPGVMSHSFLGENASDDDRNDVLIEMTSNLPDKSAKVMCVAVYYDGTNVVVGEGILNGKITANRRGDNGYGFDDIFELEDGRTLAELSIEEKKKISARYLALMDLKDKIRNLPGISYKVDDLKIIEEKYGSEMMLLCKKLFPSLLDNSGTLSDLMLKHFQPHSFLYDDLVSSRKIEKFREYIYNLVDMLNNPDNEKKNIEFEMPGYVCVEGKNYKYNYSHNWRFMSSDEIYFGPNNLYILYNRVEKVFYYVGNKYSENPDRYIFADYFVIDLEEKTVETVEGLRNDRGFIEMFGTIQKIIIKEDKEKKCKTIMIVGNKEKKEKLRYITKTIDEPVQVDITINDKNQIIGYQNDFITNLETDTGKWFKNPPYLITFTANNLIRMEEFCLMEAPSLRNFNVPSLTIMLQACLEKVSDFMNFDVPNLEEMMSGCLNKVRYLNSFKVPKLKWIGDCLCNCEEILESDVSSLEYVGKRAFEKGTMVSRRMAYVLNKVRGR